MSLIAWKDEYSVKIKEIDEQHKVLVGMVNEMHDAMSKGQGKDVLGPILDGLIEYTKKHFATEERLMQRYQFPEYNEHKAKHTKMAEKVLALQADYHKGSFQLTYEVSKFLKDWLNKHILGTDMKYSVFFNSKGVA
jgi:hemerythrin